MNKKRKERAGTRPPSSGRTSLMLDQLQPFRTVFVGGFPGPSRLYLPTKQVSWVATVSVFYFSFADVNKTLVSSVAF